MKKNVKQLITRQSMSLIQSNALSDYHKILSCPRIIIEQKWLQAQLKALYVHQYQKIRAERKIKTIKDMYIQHLQMVINGKSTITKYYPFNQTFKTAFKNIIKTVTIKYKMKPIIRSHLYQLTLKKIDRVKKERQIQKYNSKNKKIKQKQKINQDKIQHKSPVLSKRISPALSNRISLQKITPKNRNLLGVATQRKMVIKQQNYGLKNYLNKINAKQAVLSKQMNKKSKQKELFINDYNINTYYKQNLKSSGRSQKHKKSLSNSRKLILPQQSSKKTKAKVQTERSKQKKQEKKSIKKKRV